MKNFDSRTYSINDYLEWDNNNQLELSPKFQRNSVWSDNARSYLIDTIISGYPIPKVFIRQKLNVQTRLSIREVVDGQQRLRTILSFVKDGFKISKKHNAKYGGLFFSQLSSVDDDIQSIILNYEISTDLLVNMADADVLDVFGRLNSYAVILNEQEKLNSNHFGPFKSLADTLAHSYNNFWIKNRIMTEKQVLRMQDISLVAELLIAMFEGIKSKKQVKSYYAAYEKEFLFDIEEATNRFKHIISLIDEIFPFGLAESEFNRTLVFYTLFLALYHIVYSLRLPPVSRLVPIDNSLPKFEKIRTSLDRVNYLLAVETENFTYLHNDEVQFIEDCRRATTDTPVRERRVAYIINLIFD